MAKILRTEQLSVDGDNIRLTATDGNLIINSVSGDELTQITSTTKIGEDISSLAVRDTGFDTDVSSLAANTSSVESMLVNVSKYGVYSLKTSDLATGSGSSVQTITLAGRAFVSEPIITATLTGGSNDPIIAVMISDVSETATTGVYQVTFQFSDELPATGETDQATSYKLNILANVNDADQDLDTIVDSVDSDRDGDGMLNILDYDPDDSSVGKIASAACADISLHIQSDTTNSSTTFTDLSSNAHAISVFGDAQHSTTYAYLGSTSMAFDGSGDYLSVGDRSTFKFLHDGTTDYTVECWVNFSTLLSGVNPIIGTAGNSSTTGFSLYYAGSINNNNEWRALIWKGSDGVAAGRVDISDTPETNRWYHVAAVHKNNTLYFYIDGVLGGSSASANYSTADSFRELRIGSFIFNNTGSTAYSDCRIQDVRISKKAIYTSNFIPKNSLLNNPC